MPRAHDSPFAGRRVLVLGNDDRAASLVSSLAGDGIEATRAESAPEALATLDTVAVELLVVVDGIEGRPADVFGAAARRGHQLPGVFVGSKARQLPPGIEQAPAGADAAAAVIRQQLLATADAEPATDEDPLAAYGGTISHELKNHLNAARLAVDSLDGPTLEQARDSLDRLEALADEAEVIANGEVTDVESVSFSAVAEDAVERVRAPGATVRVDANGTIQADRNLLTLLLENLVRNSAEHGAPDGGNVVIRIIDTESGFAVVDDGPGFGEENPFAWGYSTGVGQGAGLGIVQRIADAHGWEITVGGDDGARVEVRTN
jgi:signal transduction histidine kinase